MHITSSVDHGIYNYVSDQPVGNIVMYIVRYMVFLGRFPRNLNMLALSVLGHYIIIFSNHR